MKLEEFFTPDVYNPDDPLFNPRFLRLGVEATDRVLGYPIDDVARLFQYSRTKAIRALTDIGAELSYSFGSPRAARAAMDRGSEALKHWARTLPSYSDASVGRLRALMYEAGN